MSPPQMIKDTTNKTYSRQENMQRQACITNLVTRTTKRESRVMNLVTRNTKGATRTLQRESRHSKYNHAPVYFTICVLLFLTACAGEPAVKPQPPPRKILAPMGYTIQIGAFSKMSNAVRLTQKLQTQGVSAYHFLHPPGLYKVRFGNYPSKHDARKRAEDLKIRAIIGEYYIVGPDDYAAVKQRQFGTARLRGSIVSTARQYIGIPYKWGGESPQTGFDCSGFTMVVYQLNGLDLPRSSSQQWSAGRPIKRSQLLKGDLVFFATFGRQKVSHVGIYLEGGKFLHAPGRGQKIKSADLSDTYFKTRYLGARAYL